MRLVRNVNDEDFFVRNLKENGNSWYKLTEVKKD